MRTGGRPCGPHSELAKTTEFRITQCPCGTVHMHIARSGVTLQLEPSSIAELVNVATAAHRKLEVGEEDAGRAPIPSGPMN
jgi:hypothetical protein